MAKTIRSLERGLHVLKALNATPISSLQDIYRSTRIPKPTLLRILLTLEKSGAVSRRLADGRYRISSNLTRLTRKRDRYDRVAEAAAPVLDRLCQKVSWPSDLMVPAGDHLEVRETSRTQSPFITYYSKDRVGMPVNWLLSAVGRAYLAYCPEHERKKVIGLLRKSDHRENWLARDQKRLDEILSETRKRGYGLRDPTFRRWPLWDASARRLGGHCRAAARSQSRARRDQHHLAAGSSLDRRYGQGLLARSSDCSRGNCDRVARARVRVTSRLLRVSFATDRSSANAQAMSAPSPRATVPAVSPNCRDGPLPDVLRAFILVSQLFADRRPRLRNLRADASAKDP